MHVIAQAGIILQTSLNQNLHKFEYSSLTITPILWKHTGNTITFTMEIDNFVIKYVINQDTQHLINTMYQRYEVTQCCKGSIYSVIVLIWNYNTLILDIPMSG